MDVSDNVRCMCGQMIRWMQVCEHKWMKWEIEKNTVKKKTSYCT